MQYKLESFTKTPFPLDIGVNASIIETKLNINYRLVGTISEIENLNSPTSVSERADELWKSTCFEWFAKSNRFAKYWEFNSATNGQWNFYQLDDYRKNLMPSEALRNPKLESSLQADQNPCFEFKVAIDLNSLLLTENLSLNELSFAITNVIKWKTGETSYFSLKHPNEKPDFHHPCGFILNFSKELK